MNKYFGTATKKSSQARYATNKTLAGVRLAIIQNKAMCLGTSDPEKWHSILREEFPDVRLRVTKDAVFINEKE